MSVIVNRVSTLVDPNQQTIRDGIAPITANGSSPVYSDFEGREIALIVNIAQAPGGTSPTLQFTLSEIDPGDGATVLSSAQSAVLSGIGAAVITLPSTQSGQFKVSWAVGGTAPSFGGTFVTLRAKNGTSRMVLRGGVKGATPAADITSTAEGVDHQATDVQIYHGGVAKDPTQVRALTISDIVTVHQGAPGTIAWPITSQPASSTAAQIRANEILAAGETVYVDYGLVAALKTLKISQFNIGGSGAGYAALLGYNAAATSLLPHGDFETSLDVAAFAAVTGSFTAPSPDTSTVQFFTGTHAMRWIYTGSATQLQRKQTFTQAIDLSSWRYLSVSFFNDGAIGTTRTLSVVVTSGTPSRTYSFSATPGGVSLPSNAWITLRFELQNPTSASGAGFDLTAVDTISLGMKDAQNKSGTVYWDDLFLSTSLDLRRRLFIANGISAGPEMNSPTEDFAAGTGVYLALCSLDTAVQDFTSIAAGYLV